MFDNFISLVCFSFSFLSADPDIRISHQSRGPYTDEGLNTCQVRNFINHGRFDLLECDNFLKTPLFSAYLFIPFKIFGTYLEAARLLVLILVALCCLIFFSVKALRSVLLLLLITTLTLFSIHQHTHLSLPEMCAASMIMISGVLYSLYSQTGKTRFVWWSYACLFLAVLFKIQFIYVLLIPPLYFLLEKAVTKQKLSADKYFLQSIWYVAITFLIIFLLWFLPFRNEFAWIAKQQSGSFSFDKLSFAFLRRNLREHFLSRDTIVFTLCFIAAVIVAVKDIRKNRIPQPLRGLIMFSFVWIVLELHKLPMEYLPVRYVISLYVAMGLFISTVAAHVLVSDHPTVPKGSIVIAVSILLMANIYCDFLAWKKRTFVISELNKYLAANNLKDKTVIGPWAPELTWESRSISFPVWKAFLRTLKPLETFRPAVIVSESDEDDSGMAYINLGINLEAISDSVKKNHIAYWDVNIYWINQNMLAPEKN
jgi:hypothetical protein